MKYLRLHILFMLISLSLSIAAQEARSDGPSLSTDSVAWQEAIDGRVYLEESDPDLESIDRPEIDLDWLKYPLVFILIGIVVFLLVKILDGKSNQKVPSEEMMIQSLEQMEETIGSADLGALLQQAIEQARFRLALRIRYLMVLKDLDEKGWIQHHKDKTNRTYVRELADQPIQEEFKNLTRLFERVWYGESAFTARDYTRVEVFFHSLEKGMIQS